MDFLEYLKKVLSLEHSSNIKTTSNSKHENLSDEKFLFEDMDVNATENFDYEKLVKEMGNSNFNINDIDIDNVPQSTLNKILGEFLKLEEVQSLADTDGNGTLSAEEAKEFVTSIIGNNNLFSTSDIESVTSNLDTNSEQNPFEDINTPEEPNGTGETVNNAPSTAEIQPVEDVQGIEKSENTEEIQEISEIPEIEEVQGAVEVQEVDEIPEIEEAQAAVEVQEVDEIPEIEEAQGTEGTENNDEIQDADKIPEIEEAQAAMEAQGTEDPENNDEIQKTDDIQGDVESQETDEVQEAEETEKTDKTEEAEKTEKAEDTDQTDETQETEKTDEVQETEKSHSPSNSDYSSYSGGGGGGGNTTPSNNTDKNNSTKKDYNKMSVSELDSEKQTQQTALQEAQKAKSDIYNGQDQNMKEGLAIEEQAKNNYKERLAEEKGISDEVKQGISEALDGISTKKAEIGAKKAEWNDASSQLSSYENKRDSLTADINTLKAQKSNLQSQVSGLSSKDATADQIKAMNDQIAQFESEIEAKAAEKTEVEAQVKTWEEKKAALGGDDGEGGEIATLKEELAQFEQSKSDWEAQLPSTISTELNEAKTEYEEVEAQMEVLQNELISQADTKIAEITSDISKIDEARNAAFDKQKTREAIATLNKDPFDANTNMTIKKINQNESGLDFPYQLIMPDDLDPNEEVPVLMYLHGSGEVGNNLSIIDTVAPSNLVGNRNSAWGNLENFRGIIICPQLTSGNWENENSANNVNAILEQVKSQYNVDPDRIAIAGHSRGGKGAIYMAQNYGNIYSKAAVVAGYASSTFNIQNVDIPIKGYVGTNDSDSAAYMNGEFKNAVGEENVIILNGASHGNAPTYALSNDTDGSGRSDFFEWIWSNT